MGETITCQISVSKFKMSLNWCFIHYRAPKMQKPVAFKSWQASRFTAVCKPALDIDLFVLLMVDVGI